MDKFELISILYMFLHINVIKFTYFVQMYCHIYDVMNRRLYVVCERCCMTR